MSLCVGHDTGVSMTVRYTNRVIALSFAALLVMMGHAEAAPNAGAVLTNFANSLLDVPRLLADIAYVAGIFFAISGVYKFKDHVDGSGTREAPVPISAGIKRFLAGGMLFSLPFMSNVMQNSLLPAGTNTITQRVALHGRPACAVPGACGMDTMIWDFMNSIAGPATFLLRVFSWIAAILLLVTGIIRLTKSAQEGPRGPGGLGTILTFIASGAFFSLADMMGVFSTSLFGNATMTAHVELDKTVVTAADALQIDPFIEALMTFITIVGFIAFIRGWFVLKAFGDGNSQVSIAQALTFLIGGTLAINLGSLVNALEATVGVTGITFS